ncbi:Transcription factor Adf-1 [Gryllus bimaculatus]|nr:Transcription factor Adf-1 [Gryllus bimaculatus]
MADTERLIELVRNHSHLYDMRHDDYKDVVKKAESWKAIAETLNQTSEAVKLKWKNLRDSYIKYLKFLNGIAGSSKKFQNWP